MRRFYAWYDRLNEPRRLLLCLLFVTMGIGPIGLGFAMKEPNLFLIFCGLFFILLLFLSRAWYLNQEAKSKELKTRGRRL